MVPENKVVGLEVDDDNDDVNACEYDLGGIAVILKKKKFENNVKTM